MSMRTLFFASCLCVVFAVTFSKRFFILESERSGGSGGSGESGTLFNKAFFVCDRLADCTHVKKDGMTNTFEVIRNSNLSPKTNEKQIIWKKVFFESCKEALLSNYYEENEYWIKKEKMNVPLLIRCKRIGDQFWALFDHDSEATEIVHGYEEPASYRRHITYKNRIKDIIPFVDSSQSCKQLTRMDCFRVAINSRGVQYTYLVDRNGNKMKYFGGGPSNGKGCRCGITGTCATSSMICECDSNDNQWRVDQGYVTEMNRLPLTEIRIGDTYESIEKAKHTIGKLECLE